MCGALGGREVGVAMQGLANASLHVDLQGEVCEPGELLEWIVVAAGAASLSTDTLPGSGEGFWWRWKCRFNDEIG